MKSTSGGVTERSTFCDHPPFWGGGGTERGCARPRSVSLMNRSNKCSSFSICMVIGMPRSVYLPVLMSSIVSCSINRKPAGMKADLLFKPPEVFHLVLVSSFTILISQPPGVDIELRTLGNRQPQQPGLNTNLRTPLHTHRPQNHVVVAFVETLERLRNHSSEVIQISRASQAWHH